MPRQDRTRRTYGGENLIRASEAPAGGGGQTVVSLASDYVTPAVAATYNSVSGLSFNVVAGTVYRFVFLIIYDVAAIGNGARFAISGPANPTMLGYKISYPLTTTSEVAHHANAYDQANAAAASSALTTGNIAVVEGIIRPSANGTVLLRAAPETAAALTIKAGSAIRVY